jgi:site-specific DNA-methyltransferase (adenine-specific)
MEKLDEKNVDVIVTSPPYNLKKKYTKYQDDIKRIEYLEWLRKVAEASSRILKDDGSFFLNFGGRPSDPWLAFDVAREFNKFYHLQNVIHWIKHISLPKDSSVKTNSLNGDVSYGHFKPINTNTYLNQCQEYIFQFTKEGKHQLDKLSIGVPYQHKSNVTRWKEKRDMRDRGNVWFIRYENKQGGFEPILHPAVFPEKLPYLCIKLHGIRDNILVYDPFIGIGTTALACLSLGVNYVGTDIDENYIEISRRRIKERLEKMSQTTINHL